MSPLLLVRNPARGQLIIAEGEYGLCAVFDFEENALTPCKIILKINH